MTPHRPLKLTVAFGARGLNGIALGGRHMVERVAAVLGMSVVLGCRPPRTATLTPPLEQLTCGDSTAAFAYYARAAGSSLADSVAGLAVRVQRGSPPTPVPAADVQVWGPQSGIGGAGDPSGTTVFREREPGLNSLRLRVTPDRRWIYAVTLRAGYLDTVIVNLDRRCTSIWHG